MAEMNGFDFNGRTIRVAYATASGGSGAPGGPGGPIDRRPYRDAPRESSSYSHNNTSHPSNTSHSYAGGTSSSYAGNNNSSNNSGQVSRNLFVANIPPHLKLNEVEAFFDQYGEGKRVNGNDVAFMTDLSDSMVVMSCVVFRQWKTSRSSRKLVATRHFRPLWTLLKSGLRRRLMNPTWFSMASFCVRTITSVGMYSRSFQVV